MMLRYLIANIATLHKKIQRKSDISIETFHKAYRTEEEKNHGDQWPP